MSAALDGLAAVLSRVTARGGLADQLRPDFDDRPKAKTGEKFSDDPNWQLVGELVGRAAANILDRQLDGRGVPPQPSRGGPIGRAAEWVGAKFRGKGQDQPAQGAGAPHKKVGGGFFGKALRFGVRLAGRHPVARDVARSLSKSPAGRLVRAGWNHLWRERDGRQQAGGGKGAGGWFRKAAGFGLRLAAKHPLARNAAASLSKSPAGRPALSFLRGRKAKEKAGGWRSWLGKAAGGAKSVIGGVASYAGGKPGERDSNNAVGRTAGRAAGTAAGAALGALLGRSGTASRLGAQGGAAVGGKLGEAAERAAKQVAGFGRHTEEVSRQVAEMNRRIGGMSGLLNQVGTEGELRDARRSRETGDRLSGAARLQMDSDQLLKDNTKEMKLLAARMENVGSAVTNAAAAIAVLPLEKLAQLLNRLFPGDDAKGNRLIDAAKELAKDFKNKEQNANNRLRPPGI